MMLWISISMLFLLILRTSFKLFSGPIFELYHVFIIFLALHSDYWKGFLFSLIAGYFIGSLSAFPSGEYAFSFSLLFSGVYLLKNVLNLENRYLWLFLPIAGTFLNFFSAGLIRALVGFKLGVPYEYLFTCLASILLLNLMELVRRRNAIPST